MIANNYITSGILENYCLGLLGVEDERKVEAMCHTYPEVARELFLLRQALEKYSGSDAIRHNEELRRNVWESVKKIWLQKHLK